LCFPDGVLRDGVLRDAQFKSVVEADFVEVVPFSGDWGAVGFDEYLVTLDFEAVVFWVWEGE